MIKASVLEELVLKALKANLMQDELVQVFCDEYKSRLDQLRSSQKTTLSK